MNDTKLNLSRRSFVSTTLALGAATAVAPLRAADSAAKPASGGTILPPAGKRLLLSCKLTMIAKKAGDKTLTVTERLRMAGDAGFDGVDFDEAGSFTADEAREAVRASGVFVHNAINHTHWGVRLTDAKQETRDKARANLDHCLRVSHAAGGSGILIVVGQGTDGPEAEIEERCRAEIKKSLPLAASLGQAILFENVWNKMMYDHDKGPEQTADRFIKFVDSFNSPWVGMYYDVGNHWKYAQPSDWIRAFGRRCVKLDVKGFSRAKNKFVDITSPDDDLPWDKVRAALSDTNFCGWATAEVGGGDVKRLTTVREQMQKAFGL
ncbi:MAG: sugar phosphate isomerase/epimerase [Verrucomicrobia bacterium]|nr:sugar phosphate isomerase/epimerase [Verrucomicrobiota bacterium]